MEEIINNVMQSPENTNPNVLRSQLQKMSGSDVYVIQIGHEIKPDGPLSREYIEIVDGDYTEAKLAAASGIPIFVIEANANAQQFSQTFYTLTNNNGSMYFHNIRKTDSKLEIWSWVWQERYPTMLVRGFNTVAYFPVPDPSTGTDGQTLKVQDGAYVLSD